MTPLRRAIGFFVDTPIVVLLGVGLLLFAGLRVAPFEALDVGWVTRDPVPVDAFPDMSDNQQIVHTEWPGRSPRDVEDQITQPLTALLLGLPGVRTVRSASAFGTSSVYVIFDDTADFYDSRTRLLERLAALPPDLLPDGVSPTLGPDATALGQVFWYTLEGHAPDGRVVGGWDRHELRTVQDWVVRNALGAVDGVSEVASIGGARLEYQVDVDPDALRAHDVRLTEVADAARQANLDVGARTMEINQVEYIVRGIGALESLDDLESAVVAYRQGVPVRISDVAHVHHGPAMQRGGLDDAGAEVVGGVVVARYRENPGQVIARVHAALAELAPSLPSRTLEDGTESRVTVVPFYDRSELVEETLETLSTALLQQILITVLVVLVLLRDVRSSLVISAMLPLGVLLALVGMRLFGVDANIMALGGIAIAIGTMVDMGIVFTENIVQHLERAEADAARGPALAEVVKRAAAEVAPAVVTSSLTTVVGFLPVFGLTDAEARLFTPLAYTKTFAMLGALLLSLTVLPTVAHFFLRRAARPDAEAHWVGVLLRPAHRFDALAVLGGAALATRYPLAGALLIALGLIRLLHPHVPARAARVLAALENAAAVIAIGALLATVWHPLGGDAELGNLVFIALAVGGVLGTFRLFEWLYPALLELFLEHRLAFLSVPLLILAVGSASWLGFDRVFGWLPTNALTTRLAERFPGLGRQYMPPFDEGAFLYMPSTAAHASTARVRRDVSEMDAAIARIPEVDRVVGKWGRAESALDPAPVSMLETIITVQPEYRTEPDGRRVRQWREHIETEADIWREITDAAARPGWTDAPVLMPIQGRILMLQTGMRAPLGLRVSAPDLTTLERYGRQLEQALRETPGVRAETVFLERVVGKPYLEVEFDRDALARHGARIAEVQRTLRVALGGAAVGQVVDGQARHPIRVRVMHERRDHVEAIVQLPVDVPGGTVPLGQLARLRYRRGPQVIRSENALPTAYVLFDRDADRTDTEVVEAVRARLTELERSGDLLRPAGATWAPAGTYEAQLRSETQLRLLVPVTLAVVLCLLYLAFRRFSTTLILYTSVAVAVAGAFVFLWLYGQPWFLDIEIAGLSLRAVLGVQPTQLSMAVWVGMLALVGVATDDGVVMSTYLDQRFLAAPPKTVRDVRDRVREAGVRRVRPCLMTTATTLLALVPVLTSDGRGADVMRAMALPSVGGMAFALITLFVVPVLYGTREELRVRLTHHPMFRKRLAEWFGASHDPANQEPHR